MIRKEKRSEPKAHWLNLNSRCVEIPSDLQPCFCLLIYYCRSNHANLFFCVCVHANGVVQRYSHQLVLIIGILLLLFFTNIMSVEYLLLYYCVFIRFRHICHTNYLRKIKCAYLVVLQLLRPSTRPFGRLVKLSVWDVRHAQVQKHHDNAFVVVFFLFFVNLWFEQMDLLSFAVHTLLVNKLMLNRNFYIIFMLYVNFASNGVRCTDYGFNWGDLFGNIFKFLIRRLKK